jgi:hypothetical protein
MQNWPQPAWKAQPRRQQAPKVGAAAMTIGGEQPVDIRSRGDEGKRVSVGLWRDQVDERAATGTRPRRANQKPIRTV